MGYIKYDRCRSTHLRSIGRFTHLDKQVDGLNICDKFGFEPYEEENEQEKKTAVKHTDWLFVKLKVWENV